MSAQASYSLYKGLGILLFRALQNVVVHVYVWSARVHHLRQHGRKGSNMGLQPHLIVRALAIAS